MIQQISISGYRLLDEFTADLGQLTVVVGANATGKSTFLDCLRLISECAEFPLQKAMNWHGRLPSLANASSQGDNLGWCLTLEKPKESPAWKSIPLDEAKQYVYDTELRVDRYGQVFPTKEVLRYAEPHRGHTDPFKFLDASGDRSMIFDPRQKHLVPFDEAVTQKQSSGKPPQDEIERALTASAQIPAPERSLRLAQMRFYNEYPILSWIRTLLASLAFYPGFDVGRFSNLRTKASEIRPETLLLSNGENLGTVLHEMLTRHNFLWASSLLKDFMKAAYPSFEEITAETAYGTPPSVLVRLRETDMHRPMELWDLSDGMLRFLCLGTALLNPFPAPFVAIDEPESGLHPRLLPIVADMIKTAAERTQVVITTHSPDLLSRFDLQEVAVMAREGPRAVWRRPGCRVSLKQMLEGVVGENLGDLLRSGELEEAGE